ncbi:MAG: lasso peptide biosynthesis B2 protein [Gemmatimonadales bacterium]|nr:lasso peptide biosynthesis B2 protein [Gemmatimonadota bacterium]MCL4213197.1 lasso peptide biosynthesis B2 protein [Gemmatimonadales bacterium]
MAPLRKLASLGVSGWRDLIRAQLALLRAQWRLRREPIGALAVRERTTPGEQGGSAGRARAIAVAVDRAARFGIFRPYCLVRAIALRDLLVRDGIHGGSIRVGVRRHQGKFEAHAWVRWGDEVLGDLPEHVAQFTEVEDLRVLLRR